MRWVPVSPRCSAVQGARCTGRIDTPSGKAGARGAPCLSPSSGEAAPGDQVSSPPLTVWTAGSGCSESCPGREARRRVRDAGRGSAQTRASEPAVHTPRCQGHGVPTPAVRGLLRAMCNLHVFSVYVSAGAVAGDRRSGLILAGASVCRRELLPAVTPARPRSFMRVLSSEPAQVRGLAVPSFYTSLAFTSGSPPPAVPLSRHKRAWWGWPWGTQH